MHRFVLHNDQIREGTEKLLAPGQAGLLNGWGVFSTIRVSAGELFAWDRHWARMKRDARKLRVPLDQDPGIVHGLLRKLVAANQAPECTLRVVVVRNLGGVFSGPDVGRPSDLIAFTASLRQWGAAVRLRYVPHGRHAACEFAGTKILAWAMNLAWLETAQTEGYDEVVLLNERGEVAECTSANIFAAKGDQVWTPPLASGCLPGVTREILLEEIRVPGLTLSEKILTPADLESADEVFITSTTRDLLAVAEISGHAIANRGTARERLSAAFARYRG
jgi:branched-chain amino acid aminotransferase